MDSEVAGESPHDIFRAYMVHFDQDQAPDIEVGWHCFAKVMHETIVNSIPFS